jgi:hypothetical protein
MRGLFANFWKQVLLLAWCCISPLLDLKSDLLQYWQMISWRVDMVLCAMKQNYELLQILLLSQNALLRNIYVLLEVDHVSWSASTCIALDPGLQRWRVIAALAPIFYN